MVINIYQGLLMVSYQWLSMAIGYQQVIIRYQ